MSLLTSEAYTSRKKHEAKQAQVDQAWSKSDINKTSPYGGFMCVEYLGLKQQNKIQWYNDTNQLQVSCCKMQLLSRILWLCQASNKRSHFCFYPDYSVPLFMPASTNRLKTKLWSHWHHKNTKRTDRWKKDPDNNPNNLRSKNQCWVALWNNN